MSLVLPYRTQHSTTGPRCISGATVSNPIHPTRMTDKTVSFGNMDSFNPENETISAYLERFNLFIQANGVAKEKKVPVFLSVIGGKTYSLLRNLLSPALLKEKDFTALATELKNHFKSKKAVTVERFNFYWRNQQVGESIATYVAEL